MPYEPVESITITEADVAKATHERDERLNTEAREILNVAVKLFTGQKVPEGDLNHVADITFWADLRVEDSEQADILRRYRNIYNAFLDSPGTSVLMGGSREGSLTAGMNPVHLPTYARIHELIAR